MPKPKESIKIVASSQYSEDRYGKEVSGQKLKVAGASPLVLRMYREDV